MDIENNFTIPADQDKSIGSTYDARRHEFLGASSILKRKPPEAALQIREISKLDAGVTYLCSQASTKKSNKLELGAEIQLCCYVGLIECGCLGKYLRNEETEAHANQIRGLFTCTIVKEEEELILGSDALKDCFDSNGLKDERATHFVSSVQYGAYIEITLESTKIDAGKKKEVEAQLENTLKIIQQLGVNGKSGTYKREELERARTNFKYKISAKGLRPDNLPKNAEETFEYFANVSKNITLKRGAALRYQLMPISTLCHYFESAKIYGRREVKRLMETEIEKLLKIFQDISKIQYDINDIYSSVIDHDFCVPQKEMDKLEKVKNNYDVAEKKFRYNLKQAYIDIRSGGDNEKERLKKVRDDFLSDRHSQPTKITRRIKQFDKLKEKFQYVDWLKNQDVIYISKDDCLKYEKMQYKTIYILFLSYDFDEADDQNTEQVQYFIKLKQKHSSARFVAVDNDVCPEKIKKSRVGRRTRTKIKLCINGRYTCEDVLAESKKSIWKKFKAMLFGAEELHVEVLPKELPMMSVCARGVSKGQENLKEFWEDRQSNVGFPEDYNHQLQFGTEAKMKSLQKVHKFAIVDELEDQQLLRAPSPITMQFGTETELKDLQSMSPLSIPTVNSIEDYLQYRNGNLQHTLHVDDGVITGITTLQHLLYVITKCSNKIKVFKIDDQYSLVKTIVVNGLTHPADIISTENHNCLYISDWKQWKVFAVDIESRDVNSYWTVDGEPTGLSFNSELKIVVSCSDDNAIKLYTTDGELEETIVLPNDIKGLRHCIQAGDTFLISYYNSEVKDLGDMVITTGVCRLNEDREILQRFESYIDPNQLPDVDQFSYSDPLQFLNHLPLGLPIRLEIDEEQQIYIADKFNNQIIVMDDEMRFVTTLLTSEEIDEPKPLRICYNKERKILIVGFENSKINIYQM